VVIDRESRMAVLRRDHPLSGRRSLTMDDLSGGSLVVTDAGVTTPELWPEHARPQVALAAQTVDDWLIAIAAGVGFGVTVTSTAHLHPHPDVRYVPLSDVDAVPLLLAWPRRGAHPALGELRGAVLESCRDPSGTEARSRHLPRRG
jgi:hypothetical protein